VHKYKNAHMGSEERPVIYLGYGDPLIGFCPYFLQAQRSEGTTSPVVLPPADGAGAGMQTTFLAWFFLHIKHQMKHE